MVNAPDSTLDQTPESFDCIGVNVPINVDLLAVIDSAMRVAACADPVVRTEVIGEHHRAGQDMLFNQPTQCVRFNIGGNEGANLPLALDHSDYRSLARPAPASSFAPASVIG